MGIRQFSSSMKEQVIQATTKFSNDEQVNELVDQINQTEVNTKGLEKASNLIKQLSSHLQTSPKASLALEKVRGWITDNMPKAPQSTQDLKAALRAVSDEATQASEPSPDQPEGPAKPGR